MRLFQTIVLSWLAASWMVTTTAFHLPPHPGVPRSPTALDDNDNDSQVTYQDTGESSKGVVGGLTTLVNSFFPVNKNLSLDTARRSRPPQTPLELQQRIRDDYELNNYLWTGDIDTGCFADDCQFTDPTISFTGLAQFVRNTQNLAPIVQNHLADPSSLQSILLNSTVTDQYIQTQWNMVGHLDGLFWKPRVDVVGSTKFWYRSMKDGNGLQVYFYDEAWEIPAGQALWQLVTPRWREQ